MHTARNYSARILVCALAALTLIAASGCGGSDDSSGKDAYTGSPGKTVDVKFSDSTSATLLTTKSSSLGTIVAGQDNRTLYSYQSANGEPIECRGECAWRWLPVVAGAGVRVTGEIDKSKVGAVSYSGKADQLTYGGHPLYYFADDPGATSVNGNGKSDAGATWHAVKADGTLAAAK